MPRWGNPTGTSTSDGARVDGTLPCRVDDVREGTGDGAGDDMAGYSANCGGEPIPPNGSSWGVLTDGVTGSGTRLARRKVKKAGHKFASVSDRPSTSVTTSQRERQ